MSRLKRLIVEIHRHSLWQIVGIYLGGSWLAYEVIQGITEGRGLPDWLPALALVLLVVGLPFVVATAFVREEAAPAPAEPSRPEAEAAAVQAGAGVGREAVGRRRVLNWRNAGFSFLVALAAWGVVATAWLVMNPHGAVEDAIADEADPGIAVLPFSVQGEGMEMWREGMADLLSTNLDGVAGLRAIDGRTVLARWREEVPEAAEGDQAIALRVARATGAKYALLGSAVALGGEVRLAADIYETEEGGQLGQVQAQGSPDSVLALVDRLAVQALVVALQKVESELPEIDLASVTTSSLPALRSWLEGEGHFRHGRVDAAVAAYERALDADSAFALAYYRLGAAYGWAEGEGSELGEEAMAKAMRLVDRLPPRQAALVRGSHASGWGDPKEAAGILERLVRSYPDYADAWYELGDFYYHSGPAIPVGLEEARRCFDRAVALDPDFAPYRIHLVHIAFNVEPDSAHVSELVSHYTELAGADASFGRGFSFALDLAFGGEERHARALQALDTLDLQVLRFIPLNQLLHPRFSEEREAIFLALEERHDRVYNQLLFWGAAGTRGLAQRGFELLDRPHVPLPERACLAQGWRMFGFPVPAERLQAMQFIAGFVDVSTEPLGLVCVGNYMADEERWEDHARVVELLDEASRLDIEAVGSGREQHAHARAVEAYGLWKRGEPDSALAALGGVKRYYATGTVRWMAGVILMDLERWDEAILYLRNWWWESLSFMNYDLARAYEATGDYEKARKEYAFFIEAWRDADPELQPWVEDARRALARLSPDR
jgi:tetratricopeptide (TPR) repeat protein